MEKIKIGNRLVGDDEPVFVIAEAGVNHNGNLVVAKKLIDVAKCSGADAIKFQAFKTDRIVTKYAQKPRYQKESGDPKDFQYDLLKELELEDNEIKELCSYAKSKNIIFLSSVFDKQSVDLLDALAVPVFKVASGEITNFPLLQYIAEKKRPIILSTGMSTLDEMKDALDIIRQNGTDEIILLHCVTSYPATAETVNLKAIEVLKRHFGGYVGFSDHTLGVIIPIAAVALGAVVIEKHLTLDKTAVGPDHKASLEPEEFKEMVRGIRTVEKALGCDLQRLAKEEALKKFVRRSIVARTCIPRGVLISEDMLDFKRPGIGISPKCLGEVIGKRAKIDISPDELITFDKLV